MGSRDRDSSRPSVLERAEQETTQAMLASVLEAVEEMKSDQQTLSRRMIGISEEIRTSNSSNVGSQLSERLDGMSERVGKLTKLVSEIGSTLSDEQQVQIADGTSVKKSDLDALKIARETSEKLEGWSSEIEKLRVEVSRKSQLKVDESKVAGVITDRLEAEIDTVVTKSTERLQERLGEHMTRLEAASTEKLDETLEKLERATAAFEKFEGKAARLGASLTWKGIGRVAAAAVPMLLVLLVLAITVGAAGQMLGLYPIYSWVWESFEAAEAWWAKLLIALGGVGSAAGLLALALFGGKKLSDIYRGL